MPYLGKSPPTISSSLEDADSDTKIQVEESADEDVIRFDIAGAEDFTMAANNFSVLSGSTLTIDSGATIANSGTATGFPAAPGKNLLINGNFDIWQRGGGTFSTGNEYTADQWKWLGTAGSGNVSRQAFTVGQTDVPGNPTYFWRGTVGTGDTSVTVKNCIEGVANGSGVSVTVSLWAKASEASTWETGDSGCNLQQRFGSGGSGVVRGNLDEDFASQAITTSWQKFVCTVTPPSISGKTVGAGNYLELYLQTAADLSSSATLDIAQVQVEIGTEAADFAHEDIGTTLQKCQRYYERLTPNTATNQAIFQAYNVTSTVASGIFNYTHKRAAPTLTFTAGATFEVRHQTTTTVCTAAAVSGSSDEDRCLCNFTVASGLTGGQGCVIRRNDTDTTYIEVSAEL